MKTMKKLLFSTLVLLLVFSTVVFLIYPGILYFTNFKGKDVKKTFTWKYPINKDGKIVFNNNECNLTIHEWDKRETEYHLIIDTKTRSDTDADILDRFLSNLKFVNTPDSVLFEDHISKFRIEILDRMMMKLVGGKKVVLSKFSMKGELWIPAGCKFVLKSKHSKIDMDDFAGQLTVDLYYGNLYGGNLTNKARIVDKFSIIEFKDINELSAKLYNSSFKAINTGDLVIDSKFSRVTALHSGTLQINSYNDNYSIPKTGDITFISKNSVLETDSTDKIITRGW
jgi:hypothetical protein